MKLARNTLITSLIIAALCSHAQQDTSRNNNAETKQNDAKLLAQQDKKYQSKIAKVEKRIAKDNYRKAIKKGTKLLQKWEQENDAQSSASYLASQTIARAYFLNGNIIAAGEALAKANEEYAALSNSNPLLASTIANSHASLLNLYGNYQASSLLLKSYLENAKPGKESEEAALIQASLLLLEALSNQGYLLAAIDLENQLIKNTEERWNPKAGKEIFKGLKKNDKKVRVNQYFELLMLRAQRLMAQGKYFEAYSLLGDNQKAFRRLENKNELKVAYYEQMAYNCLALNQLGDAEDFFEDALDRQLKQHRERNPHSIKLIAANLQVYDALDKDRKYKEVTKQYYKSLGYYRKEKTSVNTLPLLLVDLKYKLSKGKFRDADKQANKLFELTQKYNNYAHPILLTTNTNLYSYFLGRDLYNQAERSIGSAKQMSDSLFGVNSPAAALKSLTNAQFQVNYRYNFRETQATLEGKPWDDYVSNYSENHPNFLPLLNAKASAFALNDQLDGQIKNLELAKATAERIYGNNSTAYANELVLLAEANQQAGKYANVFELINIALPIIEKNEGKRNLSYLTASRVLAEYYEQTGKADLAKDIYRKTFKRLDQANKKSGLNTSAQPEKLAQVYMLSGNYDQAQVLLEKSIIQKTALFGENTLPLVEPHILLAKLYYTRGNYIKAQQEAQVANTIGKRLLNENSLRLLQANKLLADIDYALGDYKTAALRFKSVLATQQQLLGNDNPEVANTSIKLAQADYYSGGNLNQDKALVDNAVLVLETALGEKSLQTANALVYKALFEMETSDMLAAQTALTKANEIFLLQLKKGNVNEAKIFRLQGDIYTKQKDNSNALKSYESAANIYKALFDKNHPEYLKCQSKIAQSKSALGKYDEALVATEILVKSYQGFVDKVFPFLSEREKTKYWAQLKADFDLYYALVAEAAPNDKNRLAKVMESRMKTKALLLNSSVKFQKDVRSSKDEDLMALFNEWFTYKQQYASTMFLSIQELEEAGIDPIELEENAYFAEKELSGKLYGKETVGAENKSFKSLQKALGENDILVENIRYAPVRDFSKVAYAQIVMDKKGISMQVINNGDSLEKGYYNYYRNATRLRAIDKYSYQTFWEQLDGKIADNKRVYFSPDGVYNLLNPETFKDNDGKYVLDKNEVIIINNPAELLSQKVLVKPAKTKHNLIPENAPQLTAELIGNPSFYTGTNLPNKPLVKSLPGAGQEVQEIGTILNNRGIVTKSLLAEMALESDVKQLKAPKILHFATHGYFEDYEGSLVQDGIKEEGTGKHPLLLSGLLLANSGDLMANAGSSDFYAKDGVLTAFEARDIALYGTDMVVLSACETGLGKVSAGEGVYGLQRAFLDAGAKAVLMSLFKVDDEATKELMLSFYSNWLETGNKQQALSNAKKTLKLKYPDPIFWGSFVMVGN